MKRLRKRQQLCALTMIAALCSTPALASGVASGTFAAPTSSTATSITGRYATPQGATGTYTLTRTAAAGYKGDPGFAWGSTGLSAVNLGQYSPGGGDQFTYQLKLTPDAGQSASKLTIEVVQAAYSDSSAGASTNLVAGTDDVAAYAAGLAYGPGGNSEAAKMTFDQAGVVGLNPTVPLMAGSTGPQITNTYGTSTPQLRKFDSSYPQLNLAAGTANLTTSQYPALSQGDPIAANTPIQTFGALNPAATGSKYRIDFPGVSNLTVNYVANMQGSNTTVGNVLGETSREWISFGVRSVPATVSFSKVKVNGTTSSVSTNVTVASSSNLNLPAGTSAFPFNVALTSGTADNVAGTASTPLQATTLQTSVSVTEAPGTGYFLSAVNCTDTNAAYSGNPTGSWAATFTPAGAITIPASYIKEGATIACTLTNTFPPPFATCPAQAFVTRGSSATAIDLYSLDLATGTMTNLGGSSTNTNQPGDINGIGFRQQDGFVYGWSNTLGRLVKMGTNGIAVPPFATAPTSLAGITLPTDLRVADIQPSTGYYVATDGSNLYFIDVTTNKLVKAVTLGTASALSNSTDMAFNPIDGKLYAINNNTGQLMRIDPSSGTVTNLNVYVQNADGTTNTATSTMPVSGTGVVTGGYGAIFFDSLGTMYAYKSGSGSPNGQLYEIYNAASTTVTPSYNPMYTVLSASNLDGARCPSAPPPYGSLKVNKQLSPSTVTSSSAMNFNFTVTCVAPAGTYSGTVPVAANAASGSVTLNTLPIGSAGCKIAETTTSLPTAPSGYSWGTPTYTQPGDFISATTTVAGTITNLLTPNPGTITVTKNVSGATSGSAMSFAFTVTCTAPSSATYSGTVTVAAGSSTGSATVNNVPAGTSGCTIAENTSALPLAPAGYNWGAPSYTQPSGTVAPAGNISGSISNPLSPNPAAPTQSYCTAIYANPFVNVVNVLDGTTMLSRTPSLVAAGSANGISVNPMDGLIYYVDQNTGMVVRMSPTSGTETQVGVIATATGEQILGGGFDAYGNYYAFSSTKNIYKVAGINAISGTSTLLTSRGTVSAGSSGLTLSGGTNGDLAFSPDGTAYVVVQLSTGAPVLAKLDASYAVTSYVPLTIGGVAATNLAGLVIDPATGNTYVSSTSTGLYQVDASGSMTLISATGRSDLGNCPIAPAAPTLAKSFTPTSATAVPATSQLVITVSNSNLAPLYLYKALTDTLPTGMTIPAKATVTTTCTNGTVSNTTTSVTLSVNTAIPANGNCTVTVSAVSVSATGTYTNTIKAGDLVTSSGNNPADATATFTVTAPSLTLGKTVDNTYIRVVPSSSDSTSLTLTPTELIYTLTVSNTGSAAASGITVTDTLPSGLSYVAGSTTVGGVAAADPSSSGTPATLTFGAVNVPAQSGTTAGTTVISFKVKINTPTPNANLAAYVNNAAIKNTSLTASATTNTIYTRLFKQVHNLGSSATATSPAAPAPSPAWRSINGGMPGDVLEYCIDFYNYGSAALNNYTVSDILPAKTKYLGGSLVVKVGNMTSTTGDWTPVTLDQPANAATSGTVSASGMTLNPGQSGTMCFRASIQ